MWKNDQCRQSSGMLLLIIAVILSLIPVNWPADCQHWLTVTEVLLFYFQWSLQHPHSSFQRCKTSSKRQSLSRCCGPQLSMLTAFSHVQINQRDKQTRVWSKIKVQVWRIKPQNDSMDQSLVQTKKLVSDQIKLNHGSVQLQYENSLWTVQTFRPKTGRYSITPQKN